MFDFAPQINPPAVEMVQDGLRVEPVKRKARGKTMRLVAIGTILILSDGSKCEVVGHDRDGQPLCAPIEE